MIKQAGTAKVDEFHDPKLGPAVTIYLRKKDMFFLAEISGRRLQSKDGDALKGLIKEALKASLTIKWRPVVKVDLKNYRETDAYGCIEFSYDRYYVGWNGGEWMSSEWEQYYSSSWGGQKAEKRTPEVEAAKRLATMKKHPTMPAPENLKLPFLLDDSYRSEYLLDYSKELWANLKQLRDSLTNLNKKIHQLVGTQAGFARLLHLNSKPELDFTAKTEQ
jgi:hypothetical protein